MKIYVDMKTPDALDMAILDAVGDEEVQDDIRSVANKFFRFGECITIELNTDDGTARVVPI